MKQLLDSLSSIRKLDARTVTLEVSQLAQSPTCGRWKVRDDIPFSHLFPVEERLSPTLANAASNAGSADEVTGQERRCRRMGEGGNCSSVEMGENHFIKLIKNNRRNNSNGNISQNPPVGACVEIPLSAVTIHRELRLRDQEMNSSNFGGSDNDTDQATETRTHSVIPFRSQDELLGSRRPMYVDEILNGNRNLSYYNSQESDIYLVERGSNEMKLFANKQPPENVTAMQCSRYVDKNNIELNLREHQNNIDTIREPTSSFLSEPLINPISTVSREHLSKDTISLCSTSDIRPPASVAPCSSSSLDAAVHFNPTDESVMGSTSRSNSGSVCGGDGSTTGSAMLDKTNTAAWSEDQDQEPPSVANRIHRVKEIPITQYIIQLIRRFIFFNKKKGKN